MFSASVPVKLHALHASDAKSCQPDELLLHTAGAGKARSKEWVLNLTFWRVTFEFLNYKQILAACDGEEAVAG